MARTYKKAWVKDRNPFMKNYANRIVRRERSDIPDGKQYRKFFCSWSISDWSWEWPEPTLEKELAIFRHYPWSRWRDAEERYLEELDRWRKLTGNKRAHRGRERKR